MSAWDPYGALGGSVTHPPPNPPPGGHNHHLPHSHPLHMTMTSSNIAVAATSSMISTSPPSSTYSHVGNIVTSAGTMMIPPPRTSSIIHIPQSQGQPLLRGHPVSTAPEQTYTHSHPVYHTGGYPPPQHLGSHMQPHGSPNVAPPPYTNAPVIHPYPPPTATTTNHSVSPYHHHPLAPVPPLPGTAPLPPPLGVAPYIPPNPYTQPPMHVPMSTAPLTTQQHMIPHTTHQTTPHPQPYNLKVTTTGNSPQPMTAPLTPGPGPVPQTPIGGPPPTPFSNGPPGGPEHDLPPELLSAGWRKFWSKRENRWYFWNCNTGESLWDPPPLPGRYPPQPGVVCHSKD